MNRVRQMWVRLSETGFARSTRFASDGAGASGSGSRDAVEMRRGLLRMVLRDTLRMTGIPADWIQGHAMVGREPDGVVHVYWQLVVRQWSDDLARLLPLLESRLRAELSLYESDVQDWLRGVSWQFDLGDYPHHVFPAPAHWKALKLRRAGLVDDPMDAMVVHELPAPTTADGQQKLDDWMAAGQAHQGGADAHQPFADFRPTEPAPLS